MAKSILCTILVCSLSGIAYATTLSPEQALSRLNASPQHRLAGREGNFEPKLLRTIDNLYVFGGTDNFIVLPNNDEAPALLAFSDSGPFDYEKNPALRYWLDIYNKELTYLRNSESTGTDENLHWRSKRSEIEPLTKTKWNQEYPYNEMCPKVDGRETVTGCVATAMAQVMKYYNYPEKGKGSHSYYWAPGKQELTFDYENTPLKWKEMTDIYDRESTEESRRAVAELMLACGISVDMHYEPGGSGAATSRMGISLMDIFGYSQSIWMPNRVFYGLEEWEEMVYDELAQSRPVLYSGAGTDGGHQFICDGYKDEGFFHFNWGWGGLSNGYFLLTALNPDHLGVGGGAGGFNTAQVASLGVRPGQDDDKPVYIMYNTIGFNPDVKEVKAGEDFRCTGEYFNYSLHTLPEGSRLGMKFVPEVGKDGRYVEGPSVAGYHLDDGRYDLQIRFPELEDGVYTITPALHVDGKWSDVRMPVGYASYVRAIVSDNVATIEASADAEIEVSEITVPESIEIRKDFHMEFTVSNPGKTEYYSRLTPYLINQDGMDRASSLFRPVDVTAGSRERITDYVGKFTPIKDVEVTTGEYRLIFRDDFGKIVNEPVEIHLEVPGTVGIETISLDDSERPTDEVIYDLQGRSCLPPLSPGLYITHGKKLIIK